MNKIQQKCMHIRQPKNLLFIKNLKLKVKDSCAPKRP